MTSHHHHVVCKVDVFPLLDTVGSIRCRRLALIFFEILGLFENVLLDLVAVDRWVAMFGQQNDKVDLELSLDVVSLAPVGVLGFVIDDDFDLLGQDQQPVVRVSKVVLDR